MPYNFRLKEFGNGTLQLTYYHHGVFSKDDRYIPREENAFMWADDKYKYDYDDKGRSYLVSKNDDEPYLIHWKNDFPEYINSYSPFDNEFYIQKDATKLGEEEALLFLPDEESEEDLAEKRERYLRTSLTRSKKMIYDYGRSNVWEWFFTLTFEPVNGFDRDNYAECSAKVREWFKNIRKRYCSALKYLAVPEQHESGAWHFHALVSNCSELTFVPAVNNQEYRKKDGEIMLDKKGQPVPNKYFGQTLRTSYPDGSIIYNIKQYKSGFSTATQISDTRKAVSYIVKYITKDLCECTFGKRRYLPSNNLDLPTVSTGLFAPDALQELLVDIEYNYGVKLSTDCIKTYKIDVEGYENVVTVFEFNNE